MKKARFIKFTLLIIFTSIILVAAGAALVIYYFPKQKILNLIVSSGENVLKRKIVIRGIDYGLKGITLRDISIYNNLYPDDKKESADLLASVKNASLQLSFMPLLKKEFIINGIVLSNLRIIVAYENGKSNLERLLQDFKENPSDIKTKISSVRFRDAEITLKDPPEIVKPLEGKYFFNGIVNIVGDDNVLLTECEVILPKDRGAIRSDAVNVVIKNENFRISGNYILRNFIFPWLYEWAGISLPYSNFNGRIENLVITRELIEGQAKGKSKLINLPDIVSAEGQCKVDLKKETVSLLKIKGDISKTKVLIDEIKLTYSDKIKETLLGFNIPEADADIDDIKKLLNFLPSKFLHNIYGEVAGSLSYENDLFNGKMNIKNASYKSEGKDIFRVSSEISIKNNVIYKEKIPVIIYEHPCDISVSTSGKDFNKIIVNVYAKEFKFPANKEANKNTMPSFSASDIQHDISGRAELDNLQVGKYTFSNASINYSFKNGRLDFNQVYGKFAGGIVKGSGTADITGKIPRVKVTTVFEDIRVQHFANLNKELAGRFFGVAKGSTEMEFDVNGSPGIYGSIKGKVEFNIDKGKLVDTGIQKGLGLMLSELRYKLKDIEFSKIYGNINIAEGTFNINSLVFNAPDIRFKIDGHFSKPLFAVNEDTKIPGDIKIVLEYNDFFIQDIPNLPQAQFLKVPGLTMKKKGDWYNMSFRDRGDDITNSKNIKPL